MKEVLKENKTDKAEKTPSAENNNAGKIKAIYPKLKQLAYALSHIPRFADSSLSI